MTDREALEELLKLSNHYAGLLNDYDGGKRRTFATADDWIARLEELGIPLRGMNKAEQGRC